MTKTISLFLVGKNYPIQIESGLLDYVPAWVIKNIHPSKIMIVTNEKIEKKYGKLLMSGFKKRRLPACAFIIKDGESYKNEKTLFSILKQLRKMEFQRDSCLLALGGGVVGDLSGFAASIYMRGISFVQVPTTLLAQVDASIGGKNGIDFEGIKNLVGTFYQPVSVLIDPLVLKTLDDRNIRTGLAEVIKYGVIYDARFFRYLEGNLDRLLHREMKALLTVIVRSCQIKASIVSNDEREKGKRVWLNYGHTLGHALEAYYQFKSITHGEAIALGMRFASLVAFQQGLCNQTTVDRQWNLLRRAGLIPKLKTFDIKSVYEKMLLDKKVKNGRVQFILTRKIGLVSIQQNLPSSVIYSALRQVQAEACESS
jgi:3-dehydroquinate synthase